MKQSNNKLARIISIGDAIISRPLCHHSFEQLKPDFRYCHKCHKYELLMESVGWVKYIQPKGFERPTNRKLQTIKLKP